MTDRLAPLSSSGRRWAIAAVIGAAFSWATTAPIIVLILDRTEVDGVTLSLLRAGTACVVLWMFLLLRNRPALRVRPRELPGLVGFGVWSITMFYTAVTFGIAGTSASVSVSILYMAPALVVLGSAIWFGERLTVPKIVALILSLCGVLLVARVYDPSNLAGTPAGLAWIFLAAVAYAGYSLFGKQLLGKHSAPKVLAWYLLFGSLGLLVVKLFVSPRDWPPVGQLLLLCTALGLLTTLIPTTLYLWSLTRIPTSEASIISSMEEVFVVIMAWVVLGERLSPMQFLGAALILVSVLLLNTAQAKSGKEELPASVVGAGSLGLEDIAEAEPTSLPRQQPG